MPRGMQQRPHVVPPPTPIQMVAGMKPMMKRSKGLLPFLFILVLSKLVVNAPTTGVKRHCTMGCGPGVL